MTTDTNRTTNILSVGFGSLRIKCHGAVSKTFADEMGMEPGDLLLQEASTGEMVILLKKYRNDIADLIRLPAEMEGDYK